MWGTGVSPPALPPQQAAASEDEEGMEEPPEVREFLQELGESGGRGADGTSGGLPMVVLTLDCASTNCVCMRSCLETRVLVPWLLIKEHASRWQFLGTLKTL